MRRAEPLAAGGETSRVEARDPLKSCGLGTTWEMKAVSPKGAGLRVGVLPCGFQTSISRPPSRRSNDGAALNGRVGVILHGANCAQRIHTELMGGRVHRAYMRRPAEAKR